MSGIDEVSSSLLKTETNCSFRVLTFKVMPFFALRGDTPVLSFFLLLMKLHFFFRVFM